MVILALSVGWVCIACALALVLGAVLRAADRHEPLVRGAAAPNGGPVFRAEAVAVHTPSD
ncbi:hypothetical protein [Quadrisphaera sp. DSM 44207]|uniref:hypothetical protein n=1 Tax=Quadrisphaera sp. DSM 44207 TaxID=1881057 RepID=UPI000880435C|nr:hypothetical protein [Quadrisphaera sp. DSM 44207]SDQ67731.1 hypothetical protein SAMN05428996_2347 [Quadrisphaera sp. DSM 44207]